MLLSLLSLQLFIFFLCFASLVFWLIYSGIFFSDPMWLRQGTKPENNMNKFSLWQDPGVTLTQLAKPMDSSLHNSVNDPRSILLCALLLLSKSYCWLPLISVSQNYRWNSYCKRNTISWRLSSGCARGKAVKNKEWAWFSPKRLWGVRCDHGFRLLKNRMLPFQHSLWLTGRVTKVHCIFA